MMSSRLFLAATVDHFSDTGEWPPLKLLQKALTQSQDSADARREAKRLPYGHGRREKDRVVLSVRGIFGAKPNHALLDEFERVLKLAGELYERSERWVEATISYRTLIDRFSFSEHQAKRAIALLEAEALVTDSSCGAQIKVILPRIRNFLNVRTVDEYVKKRADLDRKRRIKRLLRKPLNLLRWFDGEDTKNRDKILVGALAALLAAVLSAALLLNAEEDGSSSAGAARTHPRAHGADPPPEHSRKSDAARSGG
jgi:hypothetical protein